MGLIHTLGIITSESGTNVAATVGKAAELGSDGTNIGDGFNSG